MKKFVTTIVVVGVAMLMVLFRFNILGFYHEYLQDEVVDLGGYGVEKIKDIELLDDGTMFVSSVTTKGYVGEDGYVAQKFNVLLTVINPKHRVESSYMVESFSTESDRETEILDIAMTVDDKDNVYLLVGYMGFSQPFSERFYFLYQFDADGTLIETKDISSFVDSPMFEIDMSTDNQITILELDASVLHLFDESLGFIESKDIDLNKIVQAEAFVYHGDNLVVYGKNHFSDVYAYSLVEYNINDDIATTILQTPLGINEVLYELTEEHYLYAPIEEHRWHIDELDVTIINLENYDDRVTVPCDIPSSRNKIPGIRLYNEQLYIYGWEDAPTHVDATYYVFDLEGELMDHFDSNIGGIDAVIDMYFFEDQVISVITTKRIVDADFIRRYNNDYDTIIKFH